VQTTRKKNRAHNRPTSYARHGTRNPALRGLPTPALTALGSPAGHSGSVAFVCCPLVTPRARPCSLAGGRHLRPL